MMSEIEELDVIKKPLKTKIKDIVFLILRIGIAVSLIYWLVSDDFEGIIQKMENFNFYWIIPVIILYSIHFLAGAWRLSILLRVQKIHISLIEALSLTLQGVFFSFVLPGSLGGDVVKAAFIAKRSPHGKKLAGVFTILIDRVLGMISLFTLAGAAGLVSFQFLSSISQNGVNSDDSILGMQPIQIIIYFLLTGCLVGISVTVVLFFHRQIEKIKPVKWCINLVDNITKGTISRLMNAMDIFRNSWGIMVKVFLISIFCIHLLLAGVVYCIAKGIESPSTPEVKFEIYVLATSLGNVAGSIPITPAGTGPREWVITEIFMNAFAESEQRMSEDYREIAKTIALLYLGVVFAFNLSGGVFFIVDKYLRKKK